MAKKWIQDAIKKPGSLTAAAKRAGKSIAEYCKAPPSTKLHLCFALVEGGALQ